MWVQITPSSGAVFREKNIAMARMGPWKLVLHGNAHKRNLANTIEPSIFGGPAKAAEPIEMPFGLWTEVGPSICWAGCTLAQPGEYYWTIDVWW